MNPKKLLRGALVALLAVLLLLGAAYLLFRRTGLPSREGQFQIASLKGAVDVRFDARGVPHIAAEHEQDLAAALGWLHANDRMTQMELGRRAAFGRLSEILGEGTVDTDIYFRTLRLGETAEALERAASAPSKAWLQAYAAGVNAWLRQRQGSFSPELRLLGVDPEPWKPRDSLAFALLMARDLSFWDDYPEEERFRWLRAFGADGVRELLLEPGLEVPPAIAELAAPPAPADSPTTVPEVADQASPGSNNWAIGRSRAAHGQPMLASDPHLGFRLPGVWFQVQMRSPTFEAAGMSLPGTPGVIIGRGSHVAWAFTNTQLDDQDLFFEELDEAGEHYRRGKDWRPLVRHEEIIGIKGGGERKITVFETDRGPLLAADEQRGLPPRSLAWTGHQLADPIAALSGLARSTTAEEALAAIGTYVCPAQNLVAAFDNGDLLYTVIGSVPDRRKGDGRLPSPGWDTSYGWRGLRPRDTNPTIVRPADDLLVTANNDIRPEGYALPLTADFMGPARADRIRQLLSAQPAWAQLEFARLQTDDVSLFAHWLKSALEGLGPYEGPAGQAMAALSAWDGRMAKQGTSALYALAERQLLLEVFGDEQKAHGLARSLAQRDRLLALLRGETSERFADDVATPEVEDRKTIVARGLAKAWQTGVERWGKDVASWDYGGLHTLTLSHPLDAIPLFGRWMRRGPYELNGSGETVLAMGGRWTSEGKQAITYGPSMRWVVDWSQPDRAFAVLPGGQSGHPADPHYDDQIAPYLAGEMHPAPWSETLIEQATRQRLRLVP
jgi:penicillin amidase